MRHTLAAGVLLLFASTAFAAMPDPSKDKNGGYKWLKPDPQTPQDPTKGSRAADVVGRVVPPAS
ncbi:MAG: hypothetical protein HY925_10490, partial [Elusimicrobia bacterium]|nr:hypothetical protein [Elusimicrobiota bacterium]